MHKALISCFLIGEGTLLIQCAEILLKRKHSIFGIISSHQEIVNWAQKNDIICISPEEIIIEFLSQKPFDYLFSIFNSYILPKEIIALPRKQAINYHDAFLPKYAGVNATAWALINGEKKHGITWHTISNVVDAGNILKQVEIDLDRDETVFTLNGKCYEVAIDSFSELIDELSRDRLMPIVQNLDLRTTFTSRTRLPEAGLLSFDRRAEDLDAMVRALDFRSYPNPLGSAKVIIDDNFIVVSRLKVLDNLSVFAPGTIAAIQLDCLQISTTSYDIAIQEIKTIDGRSLSIAEVVTRFGLQVGRNLERSTPEFLEKIEKCDRSISKHEAFWVKRLQNLQPIEIPYAQKGLSADIQESKKIDMAVSTTVIDFVAKYYPDCCLGDFLIAASIAYFARISNIYCFDVGFSDDRSFIKLVGLENLFASYIPLRVEIESQKSFADIFTDLQAQLKLTREKCTYFKDLTLRYPQLRSILKSRCDRLFPLAIERVENLDRFYTQLDRELTLLIPQDGEEYRWIYNSEAFDDLSIARMQSQFITFLEGIVADSRQSLACLPLLSKTERHQITIDWNDTKADYLEDKCLHQLFEKKVQESPDRVAVVFAQQQLTYRELNEKADRLASHLQKLGVISETLVGICIERSLEMIIGLLGILKAGGAYVPIDPTYPQERIAYMLSNSQVSVLLTQTNLVSQLPVCTAKIICLDREISSENRGERGGEEEKSKNLAYTIYTSGSTGKPKGVAIEHRSALNTIVDINQRFHITSKDKVLAISSLSFDLSVYDIFGLLAAGGTIVVPNPSNCPEPSQWLESLVKEQVTVWNSAPALMEVLVGYLDRNKVQLPNCLRLILLSGDRIPVNLVVQLKAMNEKLQIISLGGATEVSIWSIFYDIKDPKPEWKSIPYGRPLSNQSFYILDRLGQPVPIGIPGEIHIGGIGLARCYLNRPELTEEKFIPNPFLMAEEQRNQVTPTLYKTGDLGCYLPDGNIEFLGRLDNQVKIRGFRIELGEIESILGQHPDVETSVVIAREDISGDKRLVAYLVGNPKKILTIENIRKFLQQKLPDRMIPSAFMIISALPLTPNGKVDYRALPAPAQIREESESTIVPRDDVELQLSQIWEKLLGIKPIGIKDSFFELGGHSLLAIRLFDRIEQIFNKKLPLATLFQAPTIEELAGILRQQNWSAPWSSLVPIHSSGSKPPFFCVHSVGGNIIYYQDLADRLDPEQPFYGLQARGLDGKREPFTRIEDMAAHYIKEIRMVQPNGPYFLGGHSFGGSVAFEMAQQLDRQGEKVAFLALFDALNLNAIDEKHTLLDFLSIHYRNLAGLKWKTKLFYLGERIQRYVEKIVPKPIARVYQNLYQQVISPQQLIYQKIQDINEQALEKYVPKVYSGKFIMFRAKARPILHYNDLEYGWHGLASEEIETYEVPGDHHHMFRESDLKIFVTCLNKAQAEADMAIQRQQEKENKTEARSL
jgi:amino acid adenylation domain-containing protein